VWFGIAAAIGNTIAAGIVAAQGYIAALLPNIFSERRPWPSWVLRFRAAVANTTILAAHWANYAGFHCWLQ
jgi:hypothetical protein